MQLSINHCVEKCSPELASICLNAGDLDGGEEMNQCEGFRVEASPEAGVLQFYVREFADWAGMTNLPRFARHEYWQPPNDPTWHIRSRNCERQLSSNSKRVGSRTVCSKCMAVGSCRGTVKTVYKHALKFFAAKLLHARLFQGEDRVTETVQEMKRGGLYRSDPKKLNTIVGLNNSQL